MKKDNSYMRYLQYRQNKRRYEARTSILSALILITFLSSIVRIIKIIFIISLLALATYIIYRVIKNKKSKTKTIEVSIDDMSNDSFVNYCTQLLTLNNFTNVRIAGNSNGISILAEKEQLVFGIRCILSEAMIDADAIRKAISGGKYYFCDKVVILTNKYFTQNAINLANTKEVILWDRKKFIKMAKNDSRVKIIPA